MDRQRRPGGHGTPHRPERCEGAANGRGCHRSRGDHNRPAGIHACPLAPRSQGVATCSFLRELRCFAPEPFVAKHRRGQDRARRVGEDGQRHHDARRPIGRSRYVRTDQVYPFEGRDSGRFCPAISQGSKVKGGQCEAHGSLEEGARQGRARQLRETDGKSTRLRQTRIYGQHGRRETCPWLLRPHSLRNFEQGDVRRDASSPMVEEARVQYLPILLLIRQQHLQRPSSYGSGKLHHPQRRL
mmetsp:Transcript_14617/g.32144  ORF Transcript_14617/g.32144 Transcript_14617/m.32144 type:complete len:242 (-) Transcript_14617:136-861(-)